MAALAQQPGAADERVTGERQLDLGGEDAQFGPLDVVDEHRLGVAELGRDRLARCLGHLRSVEKHAERIAAAAVGRAEHPQDGELGLAAGAHQWRK